MYIDWRQGVEAATGVYDGKTSHCVNKATNNFILTTSAAIRKSSTINQLRDLHFHYSRRCASANAVGFTREGLLRSGRFIRTPVVFNQTVR